MTILAVAFPTTEDYAADPRVARGIKLDGPRLLIGRARDCDLRLPDLGVSRHHARLVWQGKAYVLTDEGSARGTWIADSSFDGPMRRLAPHSPFPIVGKTRLRFGPFHLSLTPHVAGPDDGPLERHMFTIDLLARIVLQLGHYPFPTLRVREGPDHDERFDLRALAGLPLIVGRCRDADFRLRDGYMSRKHFEVVFRRGACGVRDVGSKNGTRLNEKPLSPDAFVPWERGAALYAGDNVITYQSPINEALEDLDRSDEELGESRILRPFPPTNEAPVPRGPDVAVSQTFPCHEVDGLFDSQGDGDDVPPSTVRRRR